MSSNPAPDTPPVRRATARVAGSLGDRLFTATPLPPFAVGALLAAALLAALVIAAFAAGRGEAIRELGPAGLYLDRDARTVVLLVVLLAYVVTARRYVAMGARAAFDALAPVLDASAATPAERERVSHPESASSVRRRRMAGALLVVPLVALAIDRDPGFYLRRDYWSFEHLTQWISGFVLCANLGLLADASIVCAQRFDALARRRARVDLLDLDGLGPFAWVGMRIALVWLLLVAIFALNLVDVGYWVSFAGLGVASLAIAGATFVRPLLGVRERVRREKQAELARVSRALRGELHALDGSPLAARASAVSVADLLAYRTFVAERPEWPFDAPTLLRLLAYVAIPVGSWVGGAFVERLLAATLE
ncbi:MAG: hypothetical protein R3E88_11895 [Myxococcota bacterium]